MFVTSRKGGFFYFKIKKKAIACYGRQIAFGEGVELSQLDTSMEYMIVKLRIVYCKHIEFIMQYVINYFCIH